MIKAFDKIVLTRNIPSKGLEKGDIGTVVFIHSNYEGYEVEFFTLEGVTRSVETLKSSDVRAVKANEVAHARGIV